MDEEILRILEAKGVTLDRDGVMVRIPGYQGTVLVTDEQIRFYNERRNGYSIESQQRFNWVANLVEIVEVLATHGEGAPWPYFSVFWIRLHGLISEMNCEWKASVRPLGPDTETPAPGSLLAKRIELLQEVERVVAFFTEDELIYADYRRQTEGHPIQSSYAVRWSHGNGGQVLDRRGIPSMGGKEFTVAELDAAVRRVLRPFTLARGLPNESAIAVAYARRLQGRLGPVVAIMRRDFTDS
jgi:hypothetical protein